MTERRLVRADLGSHDRELERNADPLLRGLDEVAVGVGEDRELPAAGARSLKRRPRLRKRLPRRQGLREPGRLTLGSYELAHRSGPDLLIIPYTIGLNRWLHLVI